MRSFSVKQDGESKTFHRLFVLSTPNLSGVSAWLKPTKSAYHVWCTDQVVARNSPKTYGHHFLAQHFKSEKNGGAS